MELYVNRPDMPAPFSSANVECERLAVALSVWRLSALNHVSAFWACTAIALDSERSGLPPNTSERTGDVPSPRSDRTRTTPSGSMVYGEMAERNPETPNCVVESTPTSPIARYRVCVTPAFPAQRVVLAECDGTVS